MAFLPPLGFGRPAAARTSQTPEPQVTTAPADAAPVAAPVANRGWAPPDRSAAAAASGSTAQGNGKDDLVIRDGDSEEVKNAKRNKFAAQGLLAFMTEESKKRTEEQKKAMQSKA